MSKKTVALTVATAVLFLARSGGEPVKFGVVTDIQFHPGKPLGTRHYSASLHKLKEALAQFNREKVQFVVNLGDTIDHDIQAFDRVMPLFEEARAPVHHIIGNHDFEVQPEDEDRVLPALGLEKGYYALSKGGWRLIFLNGFELRYPFPADENLKKESEALYSKLLALGSENAQRWNGGISQSQIAWLERELEEAEKAGDKALVLCHFPLRPEGAHNLWNDAEVVSVLERHPPVKACFSGHKHDGNYAFQNGIHYLTFKAMVETAGQNSFAIVTLDKTAIRVQGFGREPSRNLIISALRTDIRSGRPFRRLRRR
jgi:predicted phosphodiesterase